MTDLAFTEFAETPCPWVPDRAYWTQNAGPLAELSGLLTDDFPHTVEAMNFDSAELPPDDQRRALWAITMGKQHGGQEAGEDGKKVLIPLGEGVPYMQILRDFHYGPHPLVDATVISTTTEYDLAALSGGGPHENIDRIFRATDYENIRAIAGLTGVRLRGVWDIDGEESPQALLRATGQATGTDMDELARQSPWVRQQLARSGEGWQAPFPTEHDIFRLGVEAALSNVIDWKHYDDTVEEQEVIGPNDEQRYTENGQTVVVPPREYGFVSYELTDGRIAHIANGAAASRGDDRMPRATSTSCTENALHHLTLPDQATVLALANAPHLRSAIDTTITYLDAARLGTAHPFKRIDIAAGPWVPEATKYITAALGELVMAAMKADWRLRAVLRGRDPNTPALTNI